MCYREAGSRVAYLAICIFLSLGITLAGLSVLATGPRLATRSKITTDSILTTGSVPMAQSMPTTQSTPTTGPTSAPAPDSPSISVLETILEPTFVMLPQEVVANSGDIFFVSVFAENVTNMYGWQIRLHFDPTIMECINVSIPAQNVFSEKYPVSQALVDYNDTEFTRRPLQSIENNEGYVVAGDCLLGQNQTTFYGSGLLCQVTFSAVSSGSSNLTLSTSDIQSGQTYFFDDTIELTTPSVSNSAVIVLPK